MKGRWKIVWKTINYHRSWNNLKIIRSAPLLLQSNMELWLQAASTLLDTRPTLFCQVAAILPSESCCGHCKTQGISPEHPAHKWHVHLPTLAAKCPHSPCQIDRSIPSTQLQPWPQPVSFHFSSLAYSLADGNRVTGTKSQLCAAQLPEYKGMLQTQERWGEIHLAKDSNLVEQLSALILHSTIYCIFY